MCFCNPDIRTPFCDSFKCQQELKRKNDISTQMEEVEVSIDDETFIKLAKMAHEKDITFNQLCNDIIREKMELEENKLKDENN